MNKRPFNIQDGYFDYLQMRLQEIPYQQEEKQNKPGLWVKVTPYLALVACFAVILVTGRFVFNKTVPAVQEDYITLEQLYCADLLPYTSQYSYFDENFCYDDYYEGNYTEGSLDEDALYYVLNSDMPLSYIMSTSYYGEFY